MPELNSANCKMAASEPQLRDIAVDTINMVNASNSLVDFITDKLYGARKEGTSCENAPQPNDLRTCLMVLAQEISILQNKLDSINDRL